MLATDRACPGRAGVTRCPSKLTEAVAQAGEHEGQWVEACFACGYTALLDDQQAAAERWVAHEAALPRRRRR